MPIGHGEIKHKSAYWARAYFEPRGHTLEMGRNEKEAPPHFLREWRKHRDLSQDQLAVLVDIDRTAISKMEKGLQPIMEHRLPDFAKALRIEIPQLYSPPPNAAVDIHMEADTKQLVGTRNSPALSFLPGRPTGPRDLPILGHTKAGETGFFIDQGQTWGFAMRPESLRGVDGAYAVRVHDDSMSPRYEQGEVLLVDPFRQPRPGDHVVIQLVDDQAFIKRLVRRGGGLVVCSQLNPKKEVEWKQAKVKAIHLVVGVDYLER